MVLIIEPRREVAAALHDVITSAHYNALVVPHLERLADLEEMPAAIVVRIAFEGREPAYMAIANLPANRPPIIAIAWEAAEIAEATRLHCDVVLRGHDVSHLCEALTHVCRPSAYGMASSWRRD